MPFNPTTATYADYWLDPFKAAAASLAVEAIPAPVRDSSELQSVIAAQAREPNGGLIVMPDSFMDAYRAEITSLGARYRLPAVYPSRVFADVGGLLSYGVDRTVNFRRAATYVDRTHSQRREAGRAAGANADKIRAGDQSQDREGARPRNSAGAARPLRA